MRPRRPVQACLRPALHGTPQTQALVTQHGSDAQRVLVTEARDRVGGNITTVSCAVPCCAVLRCAVLCRAVLCRAVLHCAVS